MITAVNELRNEQPTKRSIIEVNLCAMYCSH